MDKKRILITGQDRSEQNCEGAEQLQMLEKLRSEAQSVEVPPELEPEQIKARLEAEGGRVSMKQRSRQKRNGFRWKEGGRVAAAAVVLAASLGVFGVAASQPKTPATGDEQQLAHGIAEPEKEVQDLPVTDGAVDGAQGGTATEMVKELGDYHVADSYGEVGAMLEQLADARKYMNMADMATSGAADADGMAPADGAPVKEEAAAEDSVMNTQSKQSALQSDYSTTNLQVTGVDESDIVKTDGHFIYIASGDQVRIVDVSTDTPRQLGSIRPELSGNMDRIAEMYVADDRLLLIVQTSDTDSMEPVSNGFAETEDAALVDIAYPYPSPSNSWHTKVLTYDITSPAGAKLTGTFTQDGSYNSSRKIGDRLYLFTDYGGLWDGGIAYMERQKKEESGNALTEEEIKNMLPQIQGETVPQDCIYLPNDGTDSGVLIASMNVREPERATDQKLIFCGYSTLYVTKNSIILYRGDYDMATDSQFTKLTKFLIGDGKITADCAEAVAGNIEDTFAIHENSDGYMYVLTTDYTENGPTNRLFVLDERLKIHGKIEHIADGENVYAARFVDDIGYFVTYRNMDPLFTVDFSDPAHPSLIGELEIPGFSDYLQFWDDTHLIGVGEERKAEGSEFVGIKVSLYDISDPTDVKESAKLVMEDACYAPAQYYYKSLLADSKKNVIAFLTEDKGEDRRISERIFTVWDGVLKAAATDHIDETDRWYSSADYRNLYIGDKLYLVREDLVIVYDMADGFKRTAECRLN